MRDLLGLTKTKNCIFFNEKINFKSMLHLHISIHIDSFDKYFINY
jgi:hypothetical protein